MIVAGGYRTENRSKSHTLELAQFVSTYFAGLLHSFHAPDIPYEFHRSSPICQPEGSSNMSCHVGVLLLHDTVCVRLVVYPKQLNQRDVNLFPFFVSVCCYLYCCCSTLLNLFRIISTKLFLNISTSTG
eukprot:GHVT01045944.1.p1 GENE.GHVT01045944.1~~GHVT01045944.1.p1  ORF type:complete len:129 (+),score=1.85 GHVT01045944.1:1390-1776(+)